MIDRMVLDAIELARNAKAEQEKTASAKLEQEEQSRSPVAFALRKFAKQVAEANLVDCGNTPPASVTKTKTAEDEEIALKGLTLLRRFTGGNYASAV